MAFKNTTSRDWAFILVVGLIAGFLASLLVGGGGGLFGYLIKGVLGAFVGTFVLETAGIELGIRNAFARHVATATIGAIIVVLVARLLA